MPHTCLTAVLQASGSSRLLEHQVPHAERDLSLTEVYRADEMFCTGTMGELAAVTKVDGRTIGSGQAGQMTRRLSELFAEKTRAEGVHVVV